MELFLLNVLQLTNKTRKAADKTLRLIFKKATWLILHGIRWLVPNDVSGNLLHIFHKVTSFGYLN